MSIIFASSILVVRCLPMCVGRIQFQQHWPPCLLDPCHFLGAPHQLVCPCPRQCLLVLVPHTGPDSAHARQQCDWPDSFWLHHFSTGTLSARPLLILAVCSGFQSCFSYFCNFVPEFAPASSSSAGIQPSASPTMLSLHMFAACFEFF